MLKAPALAPLSDAAVAEQVERVSTARDHLLLDSRMYGIAAMRLGSVVDPTVPTACTDGTVMRWRPAYVAGLPPRQLKTLWAHEVSHCVLRHLWRLKGKNLEVANEAADYVVNHNLAKDKSLELPPGALLDPMYDDDWDFERVYAHRMHLRAQEQAKQQTPGAQQPQGQQQPGQPSPGQGQPSPAGQQPGQGQPDPTSPPQAPTGQQGPANDGPQGFGDMEPPKTAEAAKGSGEQLSEGDWSIYSEQIERMMVKAGKLPAGMARALAAAKVTPQNWREILADFISNTTPTETSWSKINKRAMAVGVQMPGVVREGVGPILVIIDTSGSVTRPMLAAMAAEVAAIREDARPECIQVVFHDTRPYPGPRFGPEDEIKLEARGGGGTAFGPVSDWVEQSIQGGEIDEPLCIVWLTDLMASDRPRDLGIPTIFATPGHIRTQPPYGEVVRMTV